MTPATLPPKVFLPRSAVIAALGDWRTLARMEREGRLTRHYPAGMKRARYKRAEVIRLLDDLAGRVS
jgi:hypothetical protein